MSLTSDLKDWRSQRNITNANTKAYVQNVLEELLEIYYEDKLHIELAKNVIWDDFFTNESLGDYIPISEQNTIDAIQDIQVFSINETELMCYDNEICNQEVYKEINSRLQCPIQKEEWKEKGAYGKWKKWSEQPVDTLYKANYNKAKVNNE